MYEVLPTGFEPVECRSQSPVPYRLAIAHCVRWLEGFEPSASRATIWRDNQLRHTHHQYFFIRLLPNEPEGIRTPDPRLRRPLLYPTELQTHSSALTAPTRYILSQSYHKCKHFFQIFLIFFKLIFRAFFMPFLNGSF